ncbi:MAG: hypothetical protein ABIA62_00890 [Candidatus Woesearchaeota archaeon]
MIDTPITCKNKIISQKDSIAGMQREYIKTVAPEERDRKIAKRQLVAGILAALFVIFSINMILEKYDSDGVAGIQKSGRVLLSTGIWMIVFMLTLLLATKFARRIEET